MVAQYLAAYSPGTVCSPGILQKLPKSFHPAGEPEAPIGGVVPVLLKMFRKR
jgi:hypothetical protein